MKSPSQAQIDFATEIYKPESWDKRKDDIVVYQVIKMPHRRGSGQRVGQYYEMQMISFRAWAIRRLDLSFKHLIAIWGMEA